MALSIKGRDGDIQLYHIKRSSKWQARYKLPNGEWDRKSTGEKDNRLAMDKAEEYFDDARFRERHGMPQKATKTFKSVAEMYITRLEEDISNNAGKAIYKGYIQITRTWLIPFFGTTQINHIDHDKVDEFERDRRSKFKSEPAKSTINQHNVVLRSIFDLAAQKKYINRNQIPKFTVKNKGKRTEIRPAFSFEEYRQLRKFMMPWSRKGRSYITRYKRQLLADYVKVLFDTGMRPGTEPLTLRWKDYEPNWIDESANKRYPRITINRGKTNERVLIGRQAVRNHFAHLAVITRNIQISPTGIINADPDGLIFCMPDGASPSDLPHMFTNLLIDSDLLYDAQGKRRALYSIRHSYAHFRILIRKTSWEVLANNMGTSILMLEQHYAHLRPSLSAAELAS